MCLSDPIGVVNYWAIHYPSSEIAVTYHMTVTYIYNTIIYNSPSWSNVE